MVTVSRLGGETRLPLKKISGPRGLLRPYILSRLSKKPMSGYDLMSDLDALTGGAWHPGPGSIYPILEDLKKKGLIGVITKGQRSKHVYTLTGKGRETLEEDNGMINQFAPKWNEIRTALMGFLSAENMSTIVLETTKSNRAVWNQVADSKELSESELRLKLKEYKLLLEDELNWATERLKSLP